MAGRFIGLGLTVLVALVGVSQLPRIADFASNTITDNLAGHRYESCRDLRSDYPYGVGQTEAVAGIKRKHQRPVAEPAVYSVNASLDHDRDGLICERVK